MESGCDDVAFSRTCEPVDSIYLHLFETGCSRYLFTRFGIERSATYIFLSLNTWHDGNGHSHVRASLIGPSLTIPFNNHRLMLGTWQQIVFVEMDTRPRQRTIIVQIIGE